MKPRNAYCSFCRKSYREVGPLVEGPGDVYICGECIELCQSIIDQEKRRRRPAGEAPPEATPEVIRGRLDQLLTGQDEAKEALVRAVLRRREPSSLAPLGPVLLIGPARSSRAFLARALAHAIAAPFAEGDGPALVPSGTEAIEPLLYRLLLATDFHVEVAERGVAYVDGIDQRATQEGLLQLWGSGRDRMGGRLQMAVSGVLFLCGGAFAELAEVADRLGRHPEQPVTDEILEGVGVAPNLIRRLQAVVRVAPLDEATLVRMVPLVDFDRVASACAERGVDADRGGDSGLPE
jgi:ATP-dependent Clp protease ATP-binding subunit ClpX